MGKFVVFGPGRALNNLTYIDDTIWGILLAAYLPEAFGKASNIAGEKSHYSYRIGGYDRVCQPHFSFQKALTQIADW